MEILGEIKIIGLTQQISSSFQKRELVITTDEQYKQHILIEFNQDKCNLLNKYKIGETVKVSINLGGREWVNPQGETKYFNSIKGWRIEAESNPKPKEEKEAFEPATNLKEEEEHDDLPF